MVSCRFSIKSTHWQRVCSQGKNRSAAAILVWMCSEAGRTLPAAVEHLRSITALACGNPYLIDAVARFLRVEARAVGKLLEKGEDSSWKRAKTLGVDMVWWVWSCKVWRCLKLFRFCEVAKLLGRQLWQRWHFSERCPSLPPLDVWGTGWQQTSLVSTSWSKILDESTTWPTLIMFHHVSSCLTE